MVEFIKPEDRPDNPSSDYLAMAADWELIADIRAGARAIRARSTKYLPRYEAEGEKEYLRRLACTPWHPEFTDALRGLCSRPFSKPVSIIEGSDRVKELALDIDGRGNNLHEFSSRIFVDAVAMGMVGIYVTYPVAKGVRTVADERSAGVRPYWVAINADDILALYTIKVAGRDVVQYIRLREWSTTRYKFADITKERVRELEVVDGGMPTWTLYEKTIDPVTSAITWAIVEEGTLTVPEIPIAMHFTGERSGQYRVKPPLADLADMQLEIYRSASRKDEVLTYAGSPMLKATGMSPPMPTREPVTINGTETFREVPAATVVIGPKTVLFAPAPAMGTGQSDWDFIQPDAANIKEIREDLNGTIMDFRRLAMQPLAPGSGTTTATASAVDAAKAHSAVQGWANNHKDMLEQAFVFTSRWLKEDTPATVSVHTDFGVDMPGASEFGDIITLRTNGDLSQKTLWVEAQRRGKLGPYFDAEKEAEQLAEEQAAMNPQGEQAIDPVTGEPLDGPPAPAPAAE
jgi:hypothetical protein